MALHTTSTRASCGGGVISSESSKDGPSPEPSGGVAFVFLDLMATMLSPLVWFFLFFVKAQSSFSSIAAQALSVNLVTHLAVFKSKLSCMVCRP
jgi:hypothetical protein